MKTSAVTVREGEYLGPVDWTFDFRESYKGFYNCSTPEDHEEMLQLAVTMLHLLEKEPDKWEATAYGGWPRCCWGRIAHIGMYDGWPYWKPIPSVYLVSPRSGDGDWHSFASITDIRLKGETWPYQIPRQDYIKVEEATE